MQRTARIVGAVLALLLLVAGTALATRSAWDHGPRPPVAAGSHQPGQPGASGDESSESPEAKASESEEASDAENDAGAQLADDHAAALVDLLKAAGIDATADQLKTLAAKYGVGGAVRLVAWADATGKSVDQIAAMFDAGTGWGAIAHQLEAADSSLHLSPGIGWIMGHGHGHAKGHAKPS